MRLPWRPSCFISGITECECIADPLPREFHAVLTGEGVLVDGRQVGVIEQRGATEPPENGYLLTVVCSCSVPFGRWITPEEAELDLLRAASLN